MSYVRRHRRIVVALDTEYDVSLGDLQTKKVCLKKTGRLVRKEDNGKRYFQFHMPTSLLAVIVF